MTPLPAAFWSLSAEELLKQLETTPQGIAREDAGRRLVRYGANSLKPQKRSTAWALLLGQFTSPIILILLLAAALSAFLGDATDALIILAIVLASGLLGFWQERGAADAIAKLLAIVKIKALVRREGEETEIPVEEIVPGDIVILNAGDTIPGDSVLLESKDLFVDEAALTGETYPVEAKPGRLPPETPLAQRTNTLYLGTHVVSGTGTAVVVRTGRDTEFGQVSERLKIREPETEFERGIRRFGFLLLEVTLLLVIGIFAINVYLARPVLESLLFALALAVGLTPQLLPAIISINLARGAKQMAQAKVIVKRLASIENFGSMNVLCSDKTGTLTEGTVRLHGACDVQGQSSDKVMQYAYLNAAYESGFVNPIDEAIRAQRDVEGFGDPKNPRYLEGLYRKLDEVPYDFIRKRLSILVAQNDSRPFEQSAQRSVSPESQAPVRTEISSGARNDKPAPSGSSDGNDNAARNDNAVPSGTPARAILITKGALTNVLGVCAFAEDSGGAAVEIATVREQIEKRYQEYSGQGFRTLGIAYRDLGAATAITKESETGMTFLGFLLFFDPPKPHIVETIGELKRLGVSLKIITGDNRLVAANVAQQVGLAPAPILTGPEIRQMSNEALVERANQVEVFAEVEPNQKERILLALRKGGNVVGYMGDGINDGSALHAADVGISVDSAVDVAKEAADLVLLEHDLGVLVQGVREGRITFANTLKYVFMATSANFGNMFSMAGASLFLPFLPLLPKQILLTNLLTDFPETTIATDSVDEELIEKPRRWDINFIRNFMIVFGLVSSIFDYVTFGTLRLLLHATEAQFRTGWFVESVISASLIVLVIRTRRPFFQSRPGRQLVIATLSVVVVTLLLPVSPLAGVLGFTVPPISFLGVLVVIIALYVATAEVAKRMFYRRIGNG